MDSSIACSNSVFEDIGCKSYVYSLKYENLHLEHQQYTCRHTQETIGITSHGTPDISSISEKKEELNVEELGIDSIGTLHVQDPHGQISGLHVTPNQDETYKSKEIRMCQELYQPVSLDAEMQKGLSRCATFECLEEVQLLSIDERMGLPCTAVQVQSSSKSYSPAYARSISLPASFKLVSAMKGGREQSGASPTMKLHVKWAAEVYDPPAVSMLDIVKNHYQYPKAKKRDHHSKHKQNKGKSSLRKNGSERKHTNHK